MHRDNVGLRIAMSNGVPLAYFFGITSGEYLATWPVYVVADDPQRLTFSIAVDDRDSLGALESDGVGKAAEARRDYVTAITMRRLHQQNFRARVLHAYRNRCAICRLKHVELLDAAHIIPDSDPRGVPAVANGLSLCKIHHAAFDRHILGISPGLKVIVREDVLEEVDGPMLRYGLQEMNGTQIIVPRDEALRPDSDLVAARYDMFVAASR
jgi:putative restriction endonuclease